MASQRILAEQPIPHSLSYERALIERVGGFCEDTLSGEDTVFNQRCLELGVPIAVDARIQMAHRNITRLGAYLRHQHAHGRGLVQCRRHLGGLGPVPLSPLALARWAFVGYPRRRWWNALKRIARGRPRWLPGYLVLSPLIWMGLWAAATGYWTEARAERREWMLGRVAADAGD